MNLIFKLFGLRKNSEIPAQCVYIADRSNPLKNSIPIVQRCSSVSDLLEYMSHYSGYIREAAIGRAVEIPSAELLLPVAGRLNDWVPEVRNAARGAILSFLTSISAADFLPALPALLALRTAKRTDHSEWLDRFEKAFIDKIDRAIIVEAIESDNSKISRACYFLASRHHLVDMSELIEMGLHSKDLIVAIQAVQMCEELDDDAKYVKYDEATRCSFGSVRCIAVRALLKSDLGVDKKELALRFLCDKQGNARDIAAQWLTGMHIDVRSYYLTMLNKVDANQDFIRISLLSLPKFSHPSDVEIVKKFAQSPSPSVRLAAFLSWVKIDPESKDSVAALVLDDESPRVRKLAVFLTQRLGAYLDFERIRRLIELRPDDRLALSLSINEKWNWLECIVLLGAANKSNAEFENILAEQLKRWISLEGRSYSHPTAHQISVLSNGKSLNTIKALAANIWPQIESSLKIHFPV